MEKKLECGEMSTEVKKIMKIEKIEKFSMEIV